MADTVAPVRQATARDFLAIIFRQLWVIVTVFVIASLSAVIVSLRTPTTYESTSKVLVSRGRKQSALQPNLQVLTWEEELSSEIETVKSLPVAERAQKILDRWAAEGKLTKPLRLALSGVDAGVVGESNVVQISYNNRDAEACVPVTNAVTQAYMDYRRDSNTVPFVNEFFQGEIALVDSAMAEVKRRRDAFIQKTGSLDPAEEQSTLFTLMQQSESDLADAQQALRLTDEYLAQARQYVSSQDVPDPGFFFSLDLGNQQSLSALKQQMQALGQERERLSSRQTADHPQMKGVLQSLEEVRQQIRREAAASIGLLEARRQAQLEKQRSIQGQIAGYRAQLGEIPFQESALSQFEHEMQTLRDRYKELVGKEIQARIQQATTPDWTVTLFQPANRPIALRTTDYVRLALAPLLSLVVGLMLAFFLDSLDHSLKTASDIEEYLGIPVLASLPETKS